MNKIEITQKIKEYIQSEYFEDTDQELDESTPLISSGVIDSISVLNLVDHLENSFNFEFESHEIDQAYLDNINLISDFIISKTHPKE